MHCISRDKQTHKSVIRFMCWAHPVFGNILFTASSNDKVVNVFQLQMTDNHQLEFVRTAQLSLQHEVRGLTASCAHGLRLSIATRGAVLLVDPISMNSPSRFGSVSTSESASQWKISHQVIINQHTVPSLGSLPFDSKLGDTLSRQRHSQKEKDVYLNGNTEIFCVSWNKSPHEALSSFAVGATANRVFLYGHLESDNVVRTQTDWQCMKSIVVDPAATFDVRSVSWCNHVARQTHYIALGCSDGMLRIIGICKKGHALEWRVVFKGQAHAGKFNVEWNQMGTCLVTSGDDKHLLLWKRVRESFVKTSIVPHAEGMDVDMGQKVDNEVMEVEDNPLGAMNNQGSDTMRDAHLFTSSAGSTLRPASAFCGASSFDAGMSAAEKDGNGINTNGLGGGSSSTAFSGGFALSSTSTADSGGAFGFTGSGTNKESNQSNEKADREEEDKMMNANGFGGGGDSSSAFGGGFNFASANWNRGNGFGFTESGSTGSDYKANASNAAADAKDGNMMNANGFGGGISDTAFNGGGFGFSGSGNSDHSNGDCANTFSFSGSGTNVSDRNEFSGGFSWQ